MCCAVVFALPALAGGEDAPKKVRIGLVKSLFHNAPEPIVQIVMRPFKALLEAQTGATGEIVISPDPDALGQQLTDDTVQIGVLQGYEFAWARLKNPQLRPI